jgi:hypothetical protein
MIDIVEWHGIYVIPLDSVPLFMWGWMATTFAGLTAMCIIVNGLLGRACDHAQGMMGRGPGEE